MKVTDAITPGEIWRLSGLVVTCVHRLIQIVATRAAIVTVHPLPTLQHIQWRLLATLHHRLWLHSLTMLREMRSLHEYELFA